MARKHENVVIDTSAYTARRYPPELVAYLRSSSGEGKVLFGTNYPMLSPARCLEDLDALGLEDGVRARFLGGNAQRLLGLGPA